MENSKQLGPPGDEEIISQPEEQEDGTAISTAMQMGSFGLSPVKTKKRKKAEVAQVGGGGGGARIIRNAGRKDRHSKVCTARGTRDRRVRLAPKTAIDFYDVQDRLGYDRPSKAIDWLMHEARAAIAALDGPPPDASVVVAGTQQVRTGNNNYNEGSFGIFTSNLLPAEFQGLAAPGGGGETFDATTFEMAKMQRILEWNYGNTPVPPMIREPLQSSYSRIASYYNNNNNNNPISARFPGIAFSNEELQGFTIPENNEMDNNNNNNNNNIDYYYPASFLQYHEH